MKKIWLAYKSDLKTNNIILIVFTLLGIGFWFLYVFAFHKTFTYRDCVDASLLIFAVLFGFSILVLLTRWGTYDTISYGFYSLAHFTFNSRHERKYSDLIDYKEQKMAKRQDKGNYYLPLLAVSTLFLIITIVFEIIYRVNL